MLLDAIAQVTAVPTDFKAATPDSRKPGAAIPAIKRAIKLPDSYVDSYFLETFGKPDRLITCECERSSEPSMTQVLHLYNGETVNKKLAASGSAAESRRCRDRQRRRSSKNSISRPPIALSDRRRAQPLTRRAYRCTR